MSKELVIGSNRHETKVAILEEDQLVEVYFQRANEYSLAGSIHKGRVTRVLPGMQSAFVDLGLERDTFLYVSDFFEEHDDIDTLSEEKPTRGERRERDSGRVVQKQAVVENRVVEIREPPPSSDVSAAGLTPAAEKEEGTDSEVGVSSESPNGRPAHRTEGDRGFRGDRRGRRSRRRRQRGRGFPENKYAQPSASQPATEAPAPETVEPEEENPADVVVLPGESLAKYRNASTKPEEVEEHRRSATANETPEDADKRQTASSAEDGEDSEEELEAEADEIDLTDKVFGHREIDERVEDDEAEGRTPEVRIDELPPPPAEEMSSPRTPQAHGIPARVETIENSYTDNPQAEPSGVSPSGDKVEQEPPDGDPIEAVEFEGADLEDALNEREPVESPEESLDPVIGSLASPETARAQTASIRDQGSRYMHRVSRRMRRRRGGNRFAQQNEFATANESVGGSAAAPALEAEMRADSLRETREDEERATPSIADLLKPGQEIIVQIAKEPLGQKGARITSHVALPGRYVVFMPSVNHLGVSRKVASDEERQRLKRILQTHRMGTTGGFIVRTAGEGVPEEEIAADMNFLYSTWLDIRQKAEKKPAPVLLHYDLDIVQRILRDQVTEDFKAIWVDNEEMYESVLTFIQRFQPALVNRVKMYTRTAPIFDAFNITQELEKALRPKVWLKSGGYIVINQTEALVAIDINTGKYVGKSNRLEDTIVKTNTEAVKEIVRQIRLRDLGGIIVVDFIDMDERKNRQKVMQALEEAMRADKAPYKILQFNDFGLVAITRKRVKQSLERTLCSPCPYCEAAGYVKSVQTVIGEILVEAQKISKAIESKDVLLRVHPDVAKMLKASDNQYLEEIEEILGRPVLVKGDAALHHEKFDLG